MSNGTFLIRDSAHVIHSVPINWKAGHSLGGISTLVPYGKLCRRGGKAYLPNDERMLRLWKMNGATMIKILRGIFIDFLFFYIRYSTLLHLPPLRFHCVIGSWDRTQDSCVRLWHWQSNALTTWLDLIHYLNVLVQHKAGAQWKQWICRIPWLQHSWASLLHFSTITSLALRRYKTETTKICIGYRTRYRYWGRKK